MKKNIRYNKDNILNNFINIFNNIKNKNIKRNFIESIDVSIVLDIDFKDINQYILGKTTLPHNNGKNYKIVILDNDLNKDKALSWGAYDVLNINDLINKKKVINYDIAIMKPNNIKYINKISNIFGNSCILPNIKLDTITNNLKDTVYDFLNGKIIYRNDKFGVINLCIGKINFDSYKLADNLFVLLNSIKLYKSKFIKKFIFIKKVYVSSTMGKSYIVKI